MTSCVATTPADRKVPDVRGMTVSIKWDASSLTVAYFREGEAETVEEAIALTKEAGDSQKRGVMRDISVIRILPETCKGTGKLYADEDMVSLNRETVDEEETKESDPAPVTAA